MDGVHNLHHLTSLTLSGYPYLYVEPTQVSLWNEAEIRLKALIGGIKNQLTRLKLSFIRKVNNETVAWMLEQCMV